MRTDQLRWTVLVFLLVAAGLLVWTLQEARFQRRFVQEALTRQASVVAQALGPSLAAASEAGEGLEEMIVWKLLDNARLLARIDVDDLGAAAVVGVARRNGLDGAAVFTADGTPRLLMGDLSAAEAKVLRDEFTDLGEEDAVLAPHLAEGIGHLAAAARSPSGRVAIVRVHASSALPLTDRLGLPHLLDELVESGAVLYLEVRRVDGPHRLAIARSWDGQPVPAAPDSGLHLVRNRTVFEVELPIQAVDGGSTRVRVGLDGRPLERAAATARRRSLLVGFSLTGFVLTGGATVFLLRLRGREREQARRRLAEVEEERRRSERLAAAGALSAGLAHEVRSPLNAIGLAAQRLERRLADEDESRVIAGRIRQEVLRLEDVLRSFLELASPVSGETETADLQELAEESVGLLRDEAGAAGVALELLPGSAPARVDRTAIQRSLVNLIRNAVQSSGAGSRVRIVADVEGGDARLRVLDEGAGVPPELEGRIFDAFVSGRPDGTGLGLPLVRRVAEEHGGSVRLTNRPEGGAEACLRMPAAREARPEVPAPRGGAGRADGSGEGRGGPR